MKINKYLAVFISAAILMSCVPSMAFASDTDDMVTEETEETEATEASLQFVYFISFALGDRSIESVQ